MGMLLCLLCAFLHERKCFCLNRIENAVFDIIRDSKGDNGVLEGILRKFLTTGSDPCMLLRILNDEYRGIHSSIGVEQLYRHMRGIDEERGESSEPT